MVEFGEFFYDGVEVASVKGFEWNRKSDSESVTIYKNDRNEGKLNLGSSGEYEVSIDSVEANPGMDEALYNACAAMVDSGSKAPLIVNLANKTLTFKNAHNADWSEKGDPSKPLELSLKFTATLVGVQWK